MSLYLLDRDGVVIVNAPPTSRRPANSNCCPASRRPLPV
jgi:hypothetical protein